MPLKDVDCLGVSIVNLAVAQFFFYEKNLSNYLIDDASKSGSGDGFKKYRKEWRLICFKYAKSAS